ncbi:unnamed protein product [Pipistrellus nathusii]|uniref:Uncharacterized protein n=1 Tax=Pipistrellus nathusii TaxID=59473 RepID=A0ABN9ZZ72_PIPNA
MSFSIPSSLSTNYQTLGSVRYNQPLGRLASNSTSVYVGARGFGSLISKPHSTNVGVAEGVGVAGGPGPG